MNAPESAAALRPTITMLALSSLVPSGTHIQKLRRERFDEKLIGELAESIKAVGILQPILVRPLAGEGGAALVKMGVFKHEIVAGERRWLGAKKAGLKEIPTTVRELTNDQVLEVQLIENLQREGLHALEEAEGYEELMKLKNIDADAIADMVGRSRSYVFKRTKLLALCPEARKAFYAGELDASKALLVARIGHHDTQRQALKDLVEGLADWNGRRRGESMSFREAHDHIVKTYMLLLKSAPFDVKDANLVSKAGACGPCPKRAGNQADLFGDVENADTCTDPKCFDDKRQAHYSVARKALEEKGKTIIHGAEAKKIFKNWDSANTYGRDQLAGGVYVKWDDSTYVGYRSVKVSEILGPDYEPVLAQHPGTGQIVKLATQQAVTKASSKKQKERKTKNASSSAAKPKVDLHALVVDRVIKELAEKVKGPLSHEDLVYIAGDIRDNSSGNVAMELMKVSYNSKLDKLSDKDLGRLIILLMVEEGLDKYSSHELYAETVCKRFKIDPEKIERDVNAEAKAKTEKGATPKKSKK